MMDKTTEDFDGVNPLYNDGWQAGQKSRDEEIKKLKAIEKDAIRMDKNITKLQDIILTRDEEIKKLTKVLSKIGNKLLFKDGCVDIMYIIEKALKGIT